MCCSVCTDIKTVYFAHDIIQKRMLVVICNYEIPSEDYSYTKNYAPSVSLSQVVEEPHFRDNHKNYRLI